MSDRAVFRLAITIACVGVLSAACTAASPDARSSAHETTSESGTSTPATSPTATSQPTPAPTSDPTRTWIRAASFRGETASINDLTSASVGFVAVGADRDEARAGQPTRGRVWVSEAGDEWELLDPDPIFASAYLTDVMPAADGAVLAFGRIEDESGSFDAVPLAAWESADGRSWHRIDPDLPPDLYLGDVEVGAKGYLLHASSDSDQLWFSADGRRWELTRELRPRSGPVYEDIQSIAAGDDVFVAVGSGASGVRVIASADGRAWFDAPPQPALEQISPAPRMSAIGGDWVIAGTADAEGDLVMWHSTDGLAWTEASSGIRDGPIEVADLAVADSTLYLTVGVAGPHPAVSAGGVWTSIDGRTWEVTDLPAGLFVRSAAASDRVIILAGAATGNVVQHATFWSRAKP